MYFYCGLVVSQGSSRCRAVSSVVRACSPVLCSGVPHPSVLPFHGFFHPAPPLSAFFLLSGCPRIEPIRAHRNYSRGNKGRSNKFLVGRGFESRQKRPKLKDENICILGDASFSHKKSIPDQKGARSSASISRVCPGRVGADPGTHLC